jgi:hypothetical protein
MGFWSSVGSFVSGIFSGGSSSSSGNSGHSSSSSNSIQTIYEPDKVRMAELENDKIGLMAEAQKEIIQMNAQMQGAIIEAETRSFEHSAKVLKSLMSDINILAQQRLTLLENGNLEIVKNIETLYSGFEKEVQKDNMNFQLKQLPQMFEVLSNFPDGSSSHTLYKDSIDKQINLNMEFVSEKIKNLLKRQQMLIESSNDAKKMVCEESAKLVQDRMIFLEQQLESRKELALLNNPNSVQNTKQIENKN